MEANFEKASQAKLRFNSNYGILTTEDLWDLSLDGLDSLAKSVNKDYKASQEESFIKTKTPGSTTLELKLEILKRVIEVKLEEKEAKKSAAEKRAKKQRLLEVLAKKQDASLESKSEEEILAELDAIDA